MEVTSPYDSGIVYQVYGPYMQFDWLLLNTHEDRDN